MYPIDVGSLDDRPFPTPSYSLAGCLKRLSRPQNPVNAAFELKGSKMIAKEEEKTLDEAEKVEPVRLAVGVPDVATCALNAETVTFTAR